MNDRHPGPQFLLRRCAVLVAALAVVGASCSGGDGATPPVEPPVTNRPVVTEPATTTTTTTTTSVPATTTTTTSEPPVDSTTTTADPSTTAAPETTVPAPPDTIYDPATPEGAAEQVILADAAAYITCLEQLPACDVAEATRFLSGDVATVVRQFFEERNSGGSEVRAAATRVVLIEDITASPDGDVAVANICIQDGTVRYFPATDDAPEEIINDTFGSTKVQMVLEAVGDSHLITAAERRESASGQENDLCA